MVSGCTETRSPARMERKVSLAPSGSAPNTRIAGCCALAIVAQPASSPPPPTGVIRASSGPVSSSNSIPAVPWPAMIMG